MVKLTSIMTVALIALLVIALMSCSTCSESTTTSSEGYAYKVAMNTVTPTILGVSIPDRSKLLSITAANSGIVPIQAQRMLANAVGGSIGQQSSMKGEQAYQADLGVIADTLEMDQTQKLLRRHLAAANTSFIPPDGLPTTDGLWRERNFIKNLRQPGLKAKVSNALSRQYPGM